MNNPERRRYEMLIRVRQFSAENAADFSAGSVGAAQFAAIAAAIVNIESGTAAQISGLTGAAQQFGIKDTARENLREELADIARTARSMEYEFVGLSDKFRFQGNMSGAVLLASARAFAADAALYEENFIAYGLPPAFIAELTAAADAFEAAFAATASATAGHVSATAENADHIKNGMVAKRILDGIVRNKYADSVGKLAAWLSASHVGRPGRKKKADTMPPPAP